MIGDLDAVGTTQDRFAAGMLLAITARAVGDVAHMRAKAPFRVEVVVEAPREVVRRAITEPDRIANWFGWDYDGLEGEIQYIFVDHAAQEPPRLLDLDDGQDRQT
ncbi:MAG TPA: hypothetical protein VE270_10665, partial [Thermoleophilaceae bacterium]|nr:hypothetical protein [Thermoleophilaceae bacterium]